VDHFEVDTVPTLLLVHPHKTAHETFTASPELLNSKIAEVTKFYDELFETEKKQAFRDIE